MANQIFRQSSVKTLFKLQVTYHFNKQVVVNPSKVLKGFEGSEVHSLVVPSHLHPHGIDKDSILFSVIIVSYGFAKCIREITKGNYNMPLFNDH